MPNQVSCPLAPLPPSPQTPMAPPLELKVTVSAEVTNYNVEIHNLVCRLESPEGL